LVTWIVAPFQELIQKLTRGEKVRAANYSEDAVKNRLIVCQHSLGSVQGTWHALLSACELIILRDKRPFSSHRGYDDTIAMGFCKKTLRQAWIILDY